MRQELMKLLNNLAGAAHSFLVLAFVGSVLIGTVGYASTGVVNAATARPTTTNISVATYNLRSQRWDGQTRSQDTWSQRKSRVKAIIAKEQPEIIGMQEVIARNTDTGRNVSQRDDVVKFMKTMGYSFMTGSAYNSSPIFWKTSDFKLIAKNEVLIFNSATSHLRDPPASRYLTTVRLQHKQTKKNVVVMNYHVNQWEQVDSQLDKLTKTIGTIHKAFPTEDAIFTGDFNKKHGDIIARLNRADVRLRVADGHGGIDHVLVTRNVSVRNWLSRGPGNPAASDHPMIVAKLKL